MKFLNVFPKARTGSFSAKKENMSEMAKNEIAMLALQIAMHHRTEKVLLPCYEGSEKKADNAFNLLRVAVLSMSALLAATHRPRDLLIMKAAGQEEAFREVTQVLWFLSDFLRESPDLLKLMDALQADLGDRYMLALRNFLDIKRAIRQIDLDFKPGCYRMEKFKMLPQKAPIGMGALCTALRTCVSMKLKESHDRYTKKCNRIWELEFITSLCFDTWSPMWLDSMRRGRFLTEEIHQGFYHMLNGFAVVFTLWPEIEEYVRAKIKQSRHSFDGLFNDQIRSNAREFLDLHR